MTAVYFQVVPQKGLSDGLQSTLKKPVAALDDLGAQLCFYARSIGLERRAPCAATRRRSCGCWPR